MKPASFSHAVEGQGQFLLRRAGIADGVQPALVVKGAQGFGRPGDLVGIDEEALRFQRRENPAKQQAFFRVFQMMDR